MNKLGGFIQEEMDKRDMSLRQFAEFIGVTHPTVKSYLSGDRTPDWAFLVKVAHACRVDIGTVAALAAPQESRTIDPDVMRLAERINNLPGVYKEAVITMINNLPLKSADDSSDKG